MHRFSIKNLKAVLLVHVQNIFFIIKNRFLLILQPIRKKPIFKRDTDAFWRKKGCRKERVLLVLKNLGSLNEVLL